MDTEKIKTRVRGTVIKFDPLKGYGFIRTTKCDKDIFVHIKNVKNTAVLERGQSVEFEVSSTQKGLSATQVTAGKKQASPYVIFSFSLAVLASCVFAYFSQQMPLMLAYLLAVNAITIAAYAYDKLIAGSSLFRVPERILHILALIGGSPSALLAQKLFRHKTSKRSFQRVYWGIVGVQLLVVMFFVNT